MLTNDLDRLRNEYARRYHNIDKALYSMSNRGHLFGIQQRQRIVLDLFRAHQLNTLANKHVLEVGCGTGSVLLEYLGYGVEINRLIGLDLLQDRLHNGHKCVPGLRLICANGESLPFRTAMYDIVLQYTAFSSILEPQIKASMAMEMIRVLKPDGLIVWYDFWLNPWNRQTKGIRKFEIRQLFPNCEYVFKRVTLAPPIARYLVPISWISALLLEKLSILNTHYLVIIKPKHI